ncbi:MAG TPA: GNAT family N-acetyltransferase [Actinocrinis sp.]|jgi:GNAT superfamily N-acetyltransferase
MAILAPARPADVLPIAYLLQELDRFYGGASNEPLDEQVAQINEALFNESPTAYALLAWTDEKLAGFASYSFLWPAASLTRSLFLKELYVVEAFRRSGIGNQLMDELHNIARARQCSRVEWMTDAPNADAQRFYEEFGVSPDQAKIFYRSTL